MQKRVLAAVAAALTGALVACIGVMAAYWWASRHVGSGGDFGWYAYSPRRYVDYLPSGAISTDWASLLVPAAIAGAILALLLMGLFHLVVRHVRIPRPG